MMPEENIELIETVEVVFKGKLLVVEIGIGNKSARSSRQSESQSSRYSERQRSRLSDHYSDFNVISQSDSAHRRH